MYFKCVTYCPPRVNHSVSDIYVISQFLTVPFSGLYITCRKIYELLRNSNLRHFIGRSINARLILMLEALQIIVAKNIDGQKYTYLS